MPQRMRTEGGSRPTRMASLRRAQTRRSRSRSAHVVVPRDKLGYVVRPCHGIRNKQYSSTRDYICHLRTALELGAGAGLLAIAAAHLGATVTATDMGRTRARSMRRPQQCKKRRGADHRETSVGLRYGTSASVRRAFLLLEKVGTSCLLWTAYTRAAARPTKVQPLTARC